jgi:EAL domain-containing protein (putative c-di-GMP-specific phosphodiesterase class I)
MQPDSTQNGNGAPDRELSKDLERAFADGEVQAYFQPTVDLRSARVMGVEALVRWIHPDLGVLTPGEFLAVAESDGQMRPLTEKVIEFAVRVAGDWWRSGLGLQLSVNLPSAVFTDPAWKLHAFVERALDRASLPGDALQFEVTEDAVMADPELAEKTLTRLGSSGASIAVDDFGTGLFSLSRLRSLPVDELKVDRSFILDVAEDDEDKTIVRSTIHMAHQMGLRVLAEGVETEAAWRQLRTMGCERAQGFLIAAPLPAREIPAWLATWNQRARELRSTSRTIRASEEPEVAETPEAAAGLDAAPA